MKVSDTYSRAEQVIAMAKHRTQVIGTGIYTGNAHAFTHSRNTNGDVGKRTDTRESKRCTTKVKLSATIASVDNRALQGKRRRM